MSELTKFQNEHGEQWNAITKAPAFSAAMTSLNLAKMQEIMALSNEDIKDNAAIILAGLRDHLRHENDLFTIGVKPSLEFGGIGPETYPNPMDDMDPPPIGDNSTPEPPAPPQPRKRKK